MVKLQACPIYKSYSSPVVDLALHPEECLFSTGDLYLLVVGGTDCYKQGVVSVLGV